MNAQEVNFLNKFNVSIVNIQTGYCKILLWTVKYNEFG